MEENQFSNFETQQKLPNATAVMVLGILSIVTCICYGIFSVVLGAVGLILAGKDKKLYMQNPSLYTNYGTLNTGKILSIIGLVLGVICIALMAWVISIVGMDALQDQELMQQRIEEYFNQ